MQVHEASESETSGRMSASAQACVEACDACTRACLDCANACLREPEIDELRECIRIDLVCAEVCRATAALVSTYAGAQDGFVVAQIEACMQVCRACAQECRLHAKMHEHCRLCAEACERCADACSALVVAGVNEELA
jgi:hypothetical protein